MISLTKSVSILTVLSLSIVSQAQLLNGDFESWSDSLQNPIYALPATNPQVATPDHWLQGGLQCRVDDSYTGNYGMLCYTYYNYVAGWISHKDYSTNKPDFLTGYYKYDLGGANYNLAEKYAEVTVWSNGDTIAAARFNFDTTSTYTYFKLPINYISNSLPDSLQVLFYTNGYGSPDIVNGFLFLDDINLEQEALGIPQNSHGEFKVYPNPTTDFVTLTFDHLNEISYELLSISGQQVISGSLQAPNGVITLDQLDAGVYLLNINQDVQIKLVKE